MQSRCSGEEQSVTSAGMLEQNIWLCCHGSLLKSPRCVRNITIYYNWKQLSRAVNMYDDNVESNYYNMATN